MKVLYVDDQQEALNAFMHAHAVDNISVEVCQDIHKIHELLDSRAPKDLPDLIVTDRYRTKGERGTESADATNQRVHVADNFQLPQMVALCVLIEQRCSLE